MSNRVACIFLNGSLVAEVPLKESVGTTEGHPDKPAPTHFGELKIDLAIAVIPDRKSERGVDGLFHRSMPGECPFCARLAEERASYAEHTRALGPDAIRELRQTDVPKVHDIGLDRPLAPRGGR